MNVSIAKFTSLGTANVAEQLEITWEQWLDYLEQEPATGFDGAMAHAGWSPVIFNPPKRAKDNVSRVFALVLDYDKGGDWDRIYTLWAKNYGTIYTTKSHASDAHRLRAVLPLTRAVTADEYAKIWEWASRVSADAQCPTDPQCKDASRFWYDPSTPAAGTWRAERLTGKPIDPEAILALVVEPPKLRVVRPASQAPSDERVKRAAAYLAKIPGAVNGSGGHTQTFNTVAHVMIGFDLSESDTLDLITNDYNPRCDPPWSEREINHKIRSVSEQCKRQRGYLLQDRPRIVSTQHAAEYAPKVSEDLDVDWMSKLLTKKDRSPRRSYYNTLIYVRHHPDYRGKWSLDVMTGTPWFDGKPIRDTLVHEIRAVVEERLGFTSAVSDVEAAILTASHDRAFHPIQQYLRSLDWDGTPRLSSMAHDYLGSQDPLHAEMVRKFMIGAAARAMNPGCKLDTALMLVGGQGIGKSTFFSILGGDWHADSFVDITNKDSFVQIHSAWIYELAELENVVTGRAESRLKAWMTSTHDMFRAPYQRTAQRKARAVVICGTTNRQQFLTDDSGSRRFWIVPVNQEIPRQILAGCRDQLWAEAMCAAEAGEPWWLSGSLERDREAASLDFQEDDPWMPIVAAHLANPGLYETTTAEIMIEALEVDVSRHDRYAQIRVGRILKELGWQRVKGERPQRGWRYFRPETQL